MAQAAPAPRPVDGAYLADHAQCEGCHQETHAQWATSAHRFASFDNPIYRAAVERFRDEVGRSASVFCGRCHDPALVIDGAMAGKVSLDDPRSTAGVTCQVCHGIERATRQGNGSYVLRTRRIFLPDPDDEASVERHRADARPIPGVELCGACHRGVLSAETGNPAALAGMDDLSGWGESRFAGTRLDRLDGGPVPTKGCRDCHMPAEEGRASHRFLGGHTWLAAMRGDEETLARTRAFLTGIADLDAAIDGRLLTVAVRNVGVGHRLPGGVRDAQATRLEVTALDSSGGRLWHDDRHLLASWIADGDGLVVRDRATHLFRALVADHTIPAGATRLARYHLPEAAAEVRIRLVHRSRNTDLLRAACRFDDRACAPQPTTEIAALDLPVADRRPSRPGPFTLAALHDVGERIARLATPADPYAQGRRLTRTGRFDAALSTLGGAPDHPATDRARGRALAAAWRHDQALPHLRRAARSAPESVSAWRELALAGAAAGQAPEGLEWGLTLAPHDPDLLRLKALRSGAPEDAARWQALRGPDNPGEQRIRCGHRSEACRRARLPIPELRPP